MTIDKPVAIVLGGTVPHQELIIQLKKRGYYTILIDYLEEPPAKKSADIHIKESTLDKEKVLEIAREYRATLVICGCVDQANITACYVMEQMGKKPPYSYETALKITNKGYMKKAMLEKNIPTSKYIYIERDEEYISEKFNLRYPVMVKPADSNSANGVRKASNQEEVEKFLENAINISRSGRAIIEEFLTGQEISAYCYIKNKKAKLLMTAERISTLDGKDEIIKCYASIAPARISVELVNRAEDIATQIAEAFELDNTPLFFQGIVKEKEIYVIEFAPRIGGGSCFRTIKENTDFDVISATIDSWEGKDVDFSLWKKPKKIIVVNTVYGEDCVFERVEGIDEVLASGDAIAYYQIRTKADLINNNKASSSRVAFFIISAKDETELLHKVKNIYTKVKVIDSMGMNRIRKDLSLEMLWDEVKMKI